MVLVLEKCNAQAANQPCAHTPTTMQHTVGKGSVTHVDSHSSVYSSL